MEIERSQRLDAARCLCGCRFLDLTASRAFALFSSMPFGATAELDAAVGAELATA
jgi:hypothetical protein